MDLLGSHRLCCLIFLILDFLTYQGNFIIIGFLYPGAMLQHHLDAVTKPIPCSTARNYLANSRKRDFRVQRKRLVNTGFTSLCENLRDFAMVSRNTKNRQGLELTPFSRQFSLFFPKPMRYPMHTILTPKKTHNCPTSRSQRQIVVCHHTPINHNILVFTTKIGIP